MQLYILLIFLEQNSVPQDAAADLDNSEYHHERSKTIVVSLAPGLEPQGNTPVSPPNPPTSPPPYHPNIPNGTPLPLGKLCLVVGILDYSNILCS